jgi:hypothetical protein
MKFTLPSPTLGFALSEITVGVIFMFVLVALIINFFDMGHVSGVLYDVQLNYKLNQVANELKMFEVNGDYPSCSELLGKAPYCTGIVFGGVKSCSCPTFELKNVPTGIFPYAGVKYQKTTSGFCMSAVANSPKKGKYLRMNYPLEQNFVRASEGC